MYFLDIFNINIYCIHQYVLIALGTARFLPNEPAGSSLTTETQPLSVMCKNHQNYYYIFNLQRAQRQTQQTLPHHKLQ